MPINREFEKWLEANYKVPETGVNYNFKNAMQKLWEFKEGEMYRAVGDHQSQINDLEEEKHSLVSWLSRCEIHLSACIDSMTVNFEYEGKYKDMATEFWGQLKGKIHNLRKVNSRKDTNYE